MKRYFKNLWLAIVGRNPFADEVEDLKEKMAKAGENVRGLNERYFSACEKWDESQHMLFECRKMVMERDKQLASQQQLVENLRERIREKDAAMEQMRQGYDKRIATYAEEIESLLHK